MGPIELDPSYDHLTLEAECRALWERTGIHRFDPDDDRPIFSIDTPPPYVSAAHLHVGHAMSYSQAEFVVRYRRMRGDRVFYPMGFDDNGLPTERYVEQTHGIDKSRTTRSEFRALCLDETARGAAHYEQLWRQLGLSVDWSLRFSTIDERSRRTAQWSFLDLFRKGRIARSSDPVMWDPVLQTALAQADIETRTRRQKLHTLRFGAHAIATTRPELLPACVALYRHPDDARYADLTEAPHPLEDRTVPVYADRDVDPELGTGLMMVCTFGDADDVRRWRRDGLATRIRIGADGRITEGAYAGLEAHTARKRILEDLGDAYLGFEMKEQTYPVAERSEAGVEWRMTPQWFVRTLDLKERLLARSAQLNWHPAWMKERLDQWIEGLKWDWNISRQRFYGVPFPVWLCEDCGEPVLAREEDLPVDPLEDPPPCEACPACGGALQGDPDVMDTWMTSSLTPFIHAAPRPMTLRVQAFEIIRTWLFSTLVKAELHDGDLPWRDVMISGWGLNEQGRKISKRDLAKDGSRYDPGVVMDQFGADALRHWAGKSQLGHDLRYHAKDVRAGRKVVVKLWNAGRLAGLSWGGFDPAAPRPTERPPEDRDLLHALDATIRTVREGLDQYDYATGLAALDRFFVGHLCDDWLETIKPRLNEPERFGTRLAAQATLYEALRDVLGLYAPYLPFVTEGLWQRLYRAHEGGESLHTTAFPEEHGAAPAPEMERVAAVMRAARAARTEARLPQSRELAWLRVDPSFAGLEPTLMAACRAREVRLEEGGIGWEFLE